MTQRNYKTLLDPSNEQLAGIADGLYRFGVAQLGGAVPDRIALLCEDEAAEMIGGLAGHSLLGRFYLMQLWVAEEHRSQGIGSELVGRMEEVARERNCGDIVVDTLNADAVTFYQRLGYASYMTNRDYIRGFDWHFLVKKIS